MNPRENQGGGRGALRTGAPRPALSPRRPAQRPAASAGAARADARRGVDRADPGRASPRRRDRYGGACGGPARRPRRARRRRRSAVPGQAVRRRRHRLPAPSARARGRHACPARGTASASPARAPGRRRPQRPDRIDRPHLPTRDSAGGPCRHTWAIGRGWPYGRCAAASSEARFVPREERRTAWGHLSKALLSGIGEERPARFDSCRRSARPSAGR